MAADLGPLPESDENARLQRESFKALNRILSHQNTFVFRDERVEDYGVDGSLELNVEGRLTNFRAQVQMKACTNSKATTSGYIPRQVASANLNHILNGTCPLYLLWDESVDAFWYLWAQDENRRLSTENPSWREQETITLQFRDRFTPDSFQQVRQRMLDSGRLLREIHDSLARATTGEQVVLSIDADTLDITNPNTATSVLLASGTAIVAAGYPKQVVELMRIVDETTRALPRMQLTRGYAECMLGNHWEAISHIRHAMARSDELSPQDNGFLAKLKDASEFHVGLIDATTYERRVRDRATVLTGLEALEAEQEVLYNRCVRSTNLPERHKLAEELRSVTEQIVNDPAALPASKLNAKLLSLFVQGIEANLAATRSRSTAKLRRMFYPEDVAGILGSLHAAQQHHVQWECQLTDALREAYDLSHPVLIFEALAVSLKIRIGRLFDDRLNAIAQNKEYVIDPIRKASLQRMMDEAARLNAANGSEEGRLRLNELRADLLEIGGDLDAAKAIAATTHPVASAMGFDFIARRAKELLDNDTLLMQFERLVGETRAKDDDLEYANDSDERLADEARYFLATLKAPAARYEIVLEHFRVIRQMAQERVNWCRHLVMLEDLSKSLIQETAYSELPSRVCRCQKFGLESDHGSVDATSVIADFKQRSCGICLARDPKQGQSPTS